jgi:hypothetical protein
LQYFFGKIVGKAHCALCDITHGTFKEKKGFSECKNDLNLPFELLHLDELNSRLKEFENEAPCIIGINNSEFKLIITKDDLEKCDSDVDLFFELLNSKIN